MNLTVEAKNIDELRAKLVDIAKGLGYNPSLDAVDPAQVPMDFSTPPAVPAAAATSPQEKPKKKAPKAEAAKEAAVVIEADTTAIPTYEEMRELKKQYFDRHGLEESKKFLKETFNVDSLKTMPAERYPEIMAKVKAALAN